MSSTRTTTPAPLVTPDSVLEARQKWDRRFLDMATLAASWSRDPSTKVGTVIADTQNRIVSLGFNGFPAGCSDDVSLYKNRERKYMRVVHAELNAILMAGSSAKECTLYCTLPPCAQCAAAAIQAGIVRVVFIRNDEREGRWGANWKEAKAMLIEADISVRELEPS